MNRAPPAACQSLAEILAGFAGPVKNAGRIRQESRNLNLLFNYLLDSLLFTPVSLFQKAWLLASDDVVISKRRVRWWLCVSPWVLLSREKWSLEELMASSQKILNVVRFTLKVIDFTIWSIFVLPLAVVVYSGLFRHKLELYMKYFLILFK